MPEVTEKYIRIPVKSRSNCQKDSIRTITISKSRGILALICRPQGSKKTIVITYLFSRDKDWDMKKAKEWLKKNKGKSCKLVDGEMLMTKKNRTFVTGQMVLKDIKPEEIDAIAELPTEGSSRYFISAELAHEGQNGNGDVFIKDELIAAYKSAKFNCIDWEHNWNQLIGSTIDSDLKAAEKDKPVALVVEGVLWRNTPAMLKDNRDAIIRKRFRDGNLSVSMETYFDRAICSICGFNSDDMMEFERHRATHVEYLNTGRKPGRILVGVEFCGMGIVETPADPIADILTLDDTALANITIDEETNKLEEEKNQGFVIQFPDGNFDACTITVDKSFKTQGAKEKFNCECLSCGHKLVSDKHCSDIKCPKCGGEMRREERPGPGKSSEEEKKEKNKGGGLMFKFEEKEYATIDDLVKAFKDGWFQISIEDNQTYVAKRGKLEDLSDKFRKALVDFVSNMEEASLTKENVEKLLSLEAEKKHEVKDNQEIEKLKAEMVKVQDEIKNRDSEIKKLNENLKDIQAKLEKAEKELDEKGQTLKEKENEEKVEKEMARFKEEELELSEDAAKKVRDFLLKNIGDEEAIKAHVSELIALYKSAKVTASSSANSALSPKGDISDGDLPNLSRVEKKYKKKENSEEE